jgi:hypothetical protein
MQDIEKAVTDSGKASSIKFNSSYINACARSLRSDVRRAARKQGFVPFFGKNDFVIGINADGHWFVQVWYELGGNGLNAVKQCSNMAI